jgi:Uma2 family endonuclease
MSTSHLQVDALLGDHVTSVAPASTDVGTKFEKVLVCDTNVSEHIIKDRRERGIDHHDEVWEGVYVMSPSADDEHQRIVHRIELAFGMVLTLSERAEVRPGVNVSDRDVNWDHNFPVPDVAVYLKGTAAKCFGTYWKGGPDFAVEVVSKNDLTRDKLDFYAQVGMRELLIVDPDPWQLELLRLADGKLDSVGTSIVESSETLASNVIPFTFKLETGDPRPAVVVGHTESEQSWQV